MLKDLLKGYIAPLLKQHGFKKEEMIWNKAVDGLIQVIDFQLSSYSDDEEESFTINIGVFDPMIWNSCWAKDAPKFIKEEDCFPRLRVGQLLSGFSNKGTDHWWTCTASTDIERLGNEISNLLEGKCLPFLDEMLAKSVVNEFYSVNAIDLMPIEKIYWAVVKSTLGELDSSNELLTKVSAISKAWANRVEVVRSQLAYPV